MPTSIDIRKKELMNIAMKYNVRVLFDNSWDRTINFNQATSSGTDLIVMNTYNNIDNMTIAFFHELAHCVKDNMYKDAGFTVPDKYITLINEASCWDFGVCLAATHGYIWDLDSPVWKYVYKCIVSYTFTASDDKYRQDLPVKRLNRDMESWLERTRKLYRGVPKTI